MRLLSLRSLRFAPSHRICSRWVVRLVDVGVNPSFQVYVSEPNWSDLSNTQYDKVVDCAKCMSQKQAIRLTLSLSTCRQRDDEDDMYYEPVRLCEVTR